MKKYWETYMCGTSVVSSYGEWAVVLQQVPLMRLQFLLLGVFHLLLVGSGPLAVASIHHSGSSWSLFLLLSRASWFGGKHALHAEMPFFNIFLPDFPYDL